MHSRTGEAYKPRLLELAELTANRRSRPGEDVAQLVGGLPR